MNKIKKINKIYLIRHGEYQDPIEKEIVTLYFEHCSSIEIKKKTIRVKKSFTAFLAFR